MERREQRHVLRLEITPAFVTLELYKRPTAHQVLLDLVRGGNLPYFCPKQIGIHEQMCF